MSNKQLIKKYFDFLKQYGFKRKIFFKNGDCSVFYSKKNISLEISIEWGIKYLPLNKSINEINMPSSWFISVILKYGYQGGNILYCDLFDKNERIKLKSDINNVKNSCDIEQILKIYAKFIFDNIICLQQFI